MHNKEMQVLEGIRAEMKTLSGHLGFYYKNLVTGLEFGVGEEEVYGAASVIKLPLFLLHGSLFYIHMVLCPYLFLYLL